MFRRFAFIFCFLMLTIFSINSVFAFDIQRGVSVVMDCVNTIKRSGVDDVVLDDIISRSLDEALDEEAVLEFCTKLSDYAGCLNDEQRVELGAIQGEIVKYLKGFIVQNFYVDIDPNFAFIIDHQTPHITVCYANKDGLLKHRRYAIKIWSVGLKIEFAIRIEAIKIIGSKFNYYDTNTVLGLGKGVEISGAVFGVGFNVLFCRIHDLDCGLLIAGIPVGISGALSMVLGGSLVPVK